MRFVDLFAEESGNFYRISFQCLVVDYSAENIFTENTNPVADLDITKTNIIPTPPDTPMFQL